MLDKWVRKNIAILRNVQQMYHEKCRWNKEENHYKKPREGAKSKLKIWRQAQKVPTTCTTKRTKQYVQNVRRRARQELQQEIKQNNQLKTKNINQEKCKK